MTTPAIGSMRLLDSATPSLPDGDYTVHVASSASSAAVTLTDDSDRHFSIVGPRFRLAKGDVASVFPGDASSGNFASAGLLPFVVLGRATLPWERVWTSSGGQPAPWLAVLVFSPDELAAGKCTAPTQVVGVSAAIGATAFAALSATLSATESAALSGVTCATMTVREDLLAQLLPSPADTRLLCHVRQVNSADMLAAGDADGLFAAVTANRTPTVPGDHLACLVSLELRSDLTNLSTTGTNFVSLLVLHSWTFTAQDAGGSFKEILSGVAGRCAVLGVGRSNPVTVSYVDETGATSQQPYHGPLVADAPAADPADPTGFAMRVAEQLGGLLAAADGTVLRAMANWRAALTAAAARNEAADDLAAAWAARPARSTRSAAPDLATALAGHARHYLDVATERAAPADRWGVPAAVRDAHAEAIGDAPADHAPLTASVRLGVVPAAPADRPASTAQAAMSSEPPVWPARIAALAPPDAAVSRNEAALRRRLGALAPDRSARSAARAATRPASAPAVPVPDVVLSFRDDVLALRRIPLAQLLPDPALVPDESIRFFYVDPDWLDRLLAGACIVGALGTSAQTQAAQAFASLAASPNAGGLDPAARVVSGFLLRSALFGGWPQPVVRAFATAPADTADPSTAMQLTPVRLEMLTPSLLIALFAGVPAAVWIEEPSHGIQAGVDPDGAGGYTVTPGVAERAPTAPIPVPLRAGGADACVVVDVTALATGGGRAWTSGQLAVQLLREPYRHIFTLS